MKRHRFLSAFICGAAALALGACGDDGVQTITAPTAGAYVRFYNFGLNAPGVNFYANDTKLTAISSTSCSPPPTTPNPACTAAGVEATTGTVYGSIGNGANYVQIPAGSYTLQGKILAATADNGLAIGKVNTTLADGKWYSYYMTGFYDATGKTSDAFILEDNFPSATADYSQAYVRFVNASPNAAAMTLYAKNTATNVETAVGSAVAFKAGGAFAPVGPGIYDLNLRAAGSSTNAVTRTGVSFSPGHVYTVSLRGDMTITSTSATNRPTLDLTSNR